MDTLQIPETPRFSDVYQLREGDIVQGGPDGIDNLPHKQLAERDAFLKARQDQVLEDLLLLDGRMSALELASGTAVRSAILLDWLYSDEAPSFELWDPGFNWRDIAPTEVIQTTNGDDTIDLASTEGLQPGQIYVLMNAAGQLLETLEISSVLTEHRARARLNLTTTLAAADGAYLARTSAAVNDRHALFSPGDAYYSTAISNLRVQTAGRLFIRRTADGTGVFSVSYRVSGSEAWATANLKETVSRSTGTRDEEWLIGIGGQLEFKILYNGEAEERCEFIALMPPLREEAAGAVARPSNASPADQAVNIGQTPTLALSGFRSLYGLSQAGAEFRIATDPNFSDIIVNSSTDYIAGWNAVQGQLDDFTDLVALGDKTYLVIASGVALRTADLAATFDTGVVTGDLKAVHHASGLCAAVGAAGALRTSTDLGDTWINRTPAAAFAGTFHGVFVRGGFLTAAGTGGEIQRSINGGAIWNQAMADGGFTGDFMDLAGDGAGNLIAVGTGGEIQTSSNDGQTWTQRNAPAAYTGIYHAVAMDDAGHAIAVGESGAIHTSADYGHTWTAQLAAAAFAGTFYGVAVKGMRVVAVGTGGEIQTSDDLGQTFVHRAAAGGAVASFRAVALDAAVNGLAIGDGGLMQRTSKLEGTGVSWPVPPGADLLQTNKVYWWSGRLQDEEGAWSEWSVPTAFATAAEFNYVTQPQNAVPASGDTSVSLLPRLQSSAFATVGTPDTHVKSRWRIASDAAMSAVVYDSGESDDLLSHQLPAPAILADAREYWWDVAHKGAANGFGPRSVPTVFTTDARPARPSIVSPAHGAVGVSSTPVIQTSAFSQAGGGTHLKTHYQLARLASFSSIAYDSGESNDLVSHEVPAQSSLSTATDYYVRVRHKSAAGWSAWSNAVMITTSDAVGALVKAGSSDGFEALWVSGSAVYLSGRLSGGYVAKFDPMLNLHGAKRLRASDGNEQTWLYGSAVDSAGNLVSVGTGRNNTTPYGGVIAKFDADLNLSVCRVLMDDGGVQVTFRAVAVDSADNIIAVGNVAVNSGGVSSLGLVAKFTPALGLIATAVFGLPAESFPDLDELTAVALDSTGAIYAGGLQSLSTPYNSPRRGLILKLDPSLALTDQIVIDGFDGIQSLMTDGAGGLLAGGYAGNQSYSGLMVAKVGTDLALGSAVEIYSSAATSYLHDLGLDGDGNILAAGGLHAGGYRRLVVSKLTPNLNHMKTVMISELDDSNAFRAVAASQSAVYAAGSFGFSQDVLAMFPADLTVPNGPLPFDVNTSLSNPPVNVAARGLTLATTNQYQVTPRPFTVQDLGLTAVDSIHPVTKSEF